jgi:drug/metabolite transporter (DMT)-like permease
MSRHWIFPYVVLVLGVLIASTSSILIRYAQYEAMPSLVIAAWRLGLAVLVLTPLAWARAGHELRHLTRRDTLAGMAAGVFLAVHFVAWTSSLAYTSVASSVALVTTNPLWVGLASWLLLRERLGWGTIGGIVLTMTGTILIVLSGIDRGASEQYANPLLGNILALVGAVMVASYFLIGRSLRRRLSLLAYIWLVYSSGAVILLLLIVAAQQAMLGFSLLAYACVLALAVGPQLLGHTSFNWALAHLSATFVALAILGEPIGSALLAWLLFQEGFGGLQLAGFVALLLGIYIAALDEQRKKAAPVSLPTSEAVSPVVPAGDPE